MPRAGTDAGESATRGAGDGAGVVGATLLATGLIPGIGPVIAGGLLAGTLSGAAMGAAGSTGVPEEEARYYAQGYRGWALGNSSVATDLSVRAGGSFHAEPDLFTGPSRRQRGSNPDELRAFRSRTVANI